MSIRDPEENFKVLWETFNKRYPFFQVRNVNWKNQRDTYRSRVTSKTSDDELFEIFCQMLDPLNDGHVELKAKATAHRKKRYFTPEKQPRFRQEFTPREIKQLLKTTEKTLVENCFGRPAATKAWMLRYYRSTPIRLTHSPSRCSVIPVAGIKLGIGRRLCVASDAEQRTEGVERVEAPVEPKREFVEVGLYRSLTP